MKRNKSPREGFTILELLIVLVILVGILALVGPRLLGSQKKADIKNTQIQIKLLEKTLKDYAFDMKGYPKTEDGLKALLRKPMDEKKARNWDGPYLDDPSLPVDAWDNSFVYKYDPKENGQDRPLIMSKGPDGEADTDDDIYNYKPRDENSGNDGSDEENELGNESEDDLSFGSEESKSDFQ
ncbi:MAG: type II secretion system major pseudopilin GspG [Planctomycetota bacterium]|nr:type II secretion system major pseudopilin GspG [Planctomycetota bacterium]